MTRVCMLTTSYPKHADDATAPFIAAIAEGVAARGADVDVVLPEHPDLVEGVRAGVRLRPFRYAVAPGLRGWGYAEALAGDVQLRRSAYAAVPFALVGTLARTLAVVARQPGGVVHAHWVIPNGVPAAVAAALCGRALVVSLHGSDVHLAESRSTLGMAARWVFQRAGAITACSPDLATRAVALGADPQRVTVVPYGVDAERYRPDPCARARIRARLGLAEDQVLVLGLGRMVYKKGFEHAIAAMTKLAASRAVLVLVGDGEARRSLEAQARQAGLGDRVRFPGAARRDETPHWFAAADVFVLPSVHDQAGNVDGLPNVLLEAMATGCAVVASDLAGVRLVMHDGEHGLIVPEGDGQALANALGSLVDNSERQARLGAAARERAATELTWARCVDGMVTAYAAASSTVAKRSPA